MVMASKATRKKKPWVLEMKAVEKWFEVDRFYNEDEAKARIKSVRKTGNKAEFRVRSDEAGAAS